VLIALLNMKLIISLILLNIISFCYANTYACLYSEAKCAGTQTPKLCGKCEPTTVNIGSGACEGGSYEIQCAEDKLQVYSNNACTTASCFKTLSSGCNDINLVDNTGTYLSYKLTGTSEC